MMEQLSVLVHTFNGYKHLWPGMIDGIKAHVYGVPVFWGTDFYEPTDTYDIYFVGGLKCDVIFSGPGEWSDRLTRLLHQMPTDYVLYIQEDMWPTQSPPDLEEMMQMVAKFDLLRLQISPIVPFYTLFSEKNTLFFDEKSKYLVSHQPSIWKKSFLLDCLKPGETPWQNEYKGTLRLQQTTQMREYIYKKIAIYPCDWYKHMCIKGKVVES